MKTEAGPRARAPALVGLLFVLRTGWPRAAPAGDVVPFRLSGCSRGKFPPPWQPLARIVASAAKELRSRFMIIIHVS